MEKSDRQPAVVRLGVDEGNHAEMPAIMAGGNRPGQLTRIFEKEVLRDGKVVRQVWKVMGTEEYGLPTNTDADVYYALMQICDEQGRPRKLHFTLYDLIERMGWGHGGSSYANARRSLKRWATVRIEATNSFYVLRDREYRGTHMWGFIEEAVVPMKDEADDRSQPVNYIVWNEHFHQSLLDGYVLSIDLDLFRRLRNRPVARRLYTFLNKKFGKKNTWASDLKKLAHVHLGIAESRSSPAQIRAILDPAIEMLCKEGFLRSCSWKKSRTGTTAFFHRAVAVVSTEIADDPLALLSRRLLGTPGGNFRQESVRAAETFIAEHGREAWSDFAEFAFEYRRDQWPEMNSIGGALTLLPKFLEVLGERRQGREAEKQAERKREWQAYIDEQIEAFRASHPVRMAAFDAEVERDSKYRFWSEAARGMHVIGGGDETRAFHLEAAREILRQRFAEEFCQDGIQSLDEWMGRPANANQPELPL